MRVYGFVCLSKHGGNGKGIRKFFIDKIERKKQIKYFKMKFISNIFSPFKWIFVFFSSFAFSKIKLFNKKLKNKNEKHKRLWHVLNEFDRLFHFFSFVSDKKMPLMNTHYRLVRLPPLFDPSTELLLLGLVSVSSGSFRFSAKSNPVLTWFERDKNIK